MSEREIFHFSHIHPLRLSPLSRSDVAKLKTNCCGLVFDIKDSSSSQIYGCNSCKFYVHKACAELPQYTRHPSHRTHTLIFVPSSPYRSTVSCDGCSKKLKGFFYHCLQCSYDLEAYCAFMPFTLNQNAHRHSLSLTYSCPYPNGVCPCDICKKRIPEKAWLYHCAECKWDAHIDCVLSRPRRADGDDEEDNSSSDAITLLAKLIVLQALMVD